jgi:predicted ArsR family transcriptional regulator
MAGASGESGGSKTRRAIVKFLKTEGPTDAARIARRLSLTPMAVRQHLYELQKQNFVVAEARAVPMGRPAKYWRLTRQADRFFPDAYAELSVSLIDALGDAFGEPGLNRVLDARYRSQRANYVQRIPGSLPLREKLKRLAQIRSDEGYMAEVKLEAGGSFLLVENHCPICAAANVCKGFCTTELDLFRSVLGACVTVERVEHIVSGDRRCAYRITPVSSPASVGNGEGVHPLR